MISGRGQDTAAVLKAFGVAVVLSAALLLLVIAVRPGPVAHAADPTAWGASGDPLAAPGGVATDAAGNVYVADTANDRILKFNPLGTPTASWGTSGKGPLQFRSPSDVAVDSSGTVYVADTGNDRIQRIFSNGQYDTEWGGFGSGTGRFDLPVAVEADSSGRVWVADRGNDRLQRFNSWGSMECAINGDGVGLGDTPCATDPGGVPAGRFTEPTGLAVRGDRVFVTAAGNDSVIRFSDEGEFETTWGGTGTGVGRFLEPAGIAVDVTGSVYVADTGNDRIQKFNSNGGHLLSWGLAGDGLGQFNRPRGIAVGTGSKVYVADTGNDRIQAFTSEGTPLTPTGPTGPTGPTSPTGPTGPSNPTGPTDPTDPGNPVINPPKQGDKNKNGAKGKKKPGKKKGSRQARIRPVRVWKEGGGRALKAGSTANIKVSVKNSGNLRTGFMRVWLGRKAVGKRSRARVQVKRQFPIRTILPGWTVTGTITVKVGRKARGKVAISAQAWGTTGTRTFRIVR